MRAAKALDVARILNWGREGRKAPQRAMRCLAGKGHSESDPCVDVTYGETEDYTVNIIESTGSGVGVVTQEDVNIIVKTLGEKIFEISVPGLTEPIEIEIHNSIGQKIYHKNTDGGNELMHKFDLSGNADGYYLIHISNNNYTLIKKIILN